jgi:PEP-CTERM motif
VSKSLVMAVIAATTAIVAVYLAPIASVFAGGSGGCVVPVPEPSSLALLAGGVAGILYLHRRKAKK